MSLPLVVREISLFHELAEIWMLDCQLDGRKAIMATMTLPALKILGLGMVMLLPAEVEFEDESQEMTACDLRCIEAREGAT